MKETLKYTIQKVVYQKASYQKAVYQKALYQKNVYQKVELFEGTLLHELPANFAFGTIPKKNKKNKENTF